MPGPDRELVLEALSALTGAAVKPLGLTCQSSTADFLTVYNFVSTALAGTGSVSALVPLVHKLSLGLDDLRNELFVDLDSFLDPQYDFDFRNLTDTSACSRGGEPYTRPVGWYRFALKVLDKYPDGNAWLGSVHWRSHSEAGEWPVSFHGTSIQGAKGIASSHYRAGPHAAFGRGVYSTPDIKVAEGYTMSKTFRSQKTGKTYKVIMQNRINPERREITVKPGYWLVPVPEGSTAGQERDIVESAIRPYGILIKELTQ